YSMSAYCVCVCDNAYPGRATKVVEWL
ncbi:hypothetical protein AVEN_123956-1, partial [Araneus ventricosus]